MPEQHAPTHQGPPVYMGRGGRFRGPPVHHINGNGPVNGVNGVNGMNGIDESLHNMTVRDVSTDRLLPPGLPPPRGYADVASRQDQVPPHRGRGSDRDTDSASSSHARGGPAKTVNGVPAGAVAGTGRPSPKPVVPKQRVPNADEFPVLGGSTTPPARSPAASVNGHVNGHSGPTAAQVLQAAPPPSRKDLVKELFRGAHSQVRTAPASSANHLS
jgi:hypothetical protein